MHKLHPIRQPQVYFLLLDSYKILTKNIARKIFRFLTATEIPCAYKIFLKQAGVISSGFASWNLEITLSKCQQFSLTTFLKMGFWGTSSVSFGVLSLIFDLWVIKFCTGTEHTFWPNPHFRLDLFWISSFLRKFLHFL